METSLEVFSRFLKYLIYSKQKKKKKFNKEKNKGMPSLNWTKKYFTGEWIFSSLLLMSDIFICPIKIDSNLLTFSSWLDMCLTIKSTATVFVPSIKMKRNKINNKSVRRFFENCVVLVSLNRWKYRCGYCGSVAEWLGRQA